MTDHTLEDWEYAQLASYAGEPEKAALVARRAASWSARGACAPHAHAWSGTRVEYRVQTNNDSYNTLCPDLLTVTINYARALRSITSIMPGQPWRDTGHKAHMPGVTMLHHATRG